MKRMGRYNGTPIDEVDARELGLLATCDVCHREVERGELCDGICGECVAVGAGRDRDDDENEQSTESDV